LIRAYTIPFVEFFSAQLLEIFLIYCKIHFLSAVLPDDKTMKKQVESEKWDENY